MLQETSLPPLVVVVPTSPKEALNRSQKSSCPEFVSPLHKPHTKPLSYEDDVPTETTKPLSATASVSVASDIDSSCDGSISSSNSCLEDEEFSTSMEFELEVKKLKELKQRRESNSLKHPESFQSPLHPYAQRHLPVQRHSQLHPQQEKQLKHKAMREQTEMIHEIHGMLSLLIDESRESTRTSRSKVNSTYSGRSRSRNNEEHSERQQSIRDIALLARDCMGRLEDNIDELHGSFSSIGKSMRNKPISKYHHSHRGAHRSAGVVALPETYDPRRPVEDSGSLHRIPLPNSFKAIGAPPLYNHDDDFQSKRLVSPDGISKRLLSERSVKPQTPRQGKRISQSLHNTFSSPKAQKPLRMSLHRPPITPSMHERFSASFDFEKSPQVQKAMRMSSHRRTMPVAPCLNQSFSESFDYEDSPSVRQSSRKTAPPSLYEQFSPRFDYEKSPQVQKALRLSTHKRTTKQRSSITSQGSRRSRVMAASPGVRKSLVGDTLQQKVHKARPNLEGRIARILDEFENPEHLRNILADPEEGMTERIVEVLESLKGSGRSSQRTMIK